MPISTSTIMNNPFIQFVNKGKINNFSQLKRAYRKIIMKTHPDAIGSDHLVDKLIEFSNYYEEAKTFILEANKHLTNISKFQLNHRLIFFQQLHFIESLEAPYAYKPDNYKTIIYEAKMKAANSFQNWVSRKIEVYMKANKEYEIIKAHKPDEPYLKDALKLNLMPVFHNIISYHLTGHDYYKTQIRQNIKAILHRLEQEEYISLKEYINFLINDLHNGPAIFSYSTII